MKKEILVSLTTAGNPDWRKTITELKEHRVKRFALFLTMMSDPNERMDLMEAIKKEIPDAEIPFAHIRPDMSPSELDFLIKNFNLKAMNIHPTREYPLIHDYSKYMGMIYIENGGPANRDGLRSSDLEGFAGICLDVSHLEDSKRKGCVAYEINLDMARKNLIGANHVSAIYNEIGTGLVMGRRGYDFHKYELLENFDYLKNYGSEFFGRFIAIELYNSIAEQLEAKEYIENIVL